MSLSDASQPLAGAPVVEETIEEKQPTRKFDWGALVRSQTFWLVTVTFVAFLFCFWPLIPREIFGIEVKSWNPLDLKFHGRWSDMEGYYAHGFLIPICSAYLIWEKWDKIKAFPIKPQWWAMILILPVLYVALAASRCIMPTMLSGLIVATLLLSVLFVAGWKWLSALTAPIVFLFFGLPVLDQIVDVTTKPLQQISSSIAFHTMQIVGLQPFRDSDPTIMYVPNFPQQLAVAAACSGLRTTIAICAAVVFFMLIARLKWWANLLLALSAIPLSVLINGIRIAMIGFAANTWPAFAGDNFQQMHDISGYVALGLCFVILGWFTRRLGYK